jgi:hypothetical protein
LLHDDRRIAFARVTPDTQKKWREHAAHEESLRFRGGFKYFLQFKLVIVISLKPVVIAATKS